MWRQKKRFRGDFLSKKLEAIRWLRIEKKLEEILLNVNMKFDPNQYKSMSSYVIYVIGKTSKIEAF